MPHLPRPQNTLRGDKNRIVKKFGPKKLIPSSPYVYVEIYLFYAVVDFTIPLLLTHDSIKRKDVLLVCSQKVVEDVVKI